MDDDLEPILEARSSRESRPRSSLVRSPVVAGWRRSLRPERSRVRRSRKPAPIRQLDDGGARTQNVSVESNDGKAVGAGSRPRSRP